MTYSSHLLPPNARPTSQDFAGLADPDIIWEDARWRRFTERTDLHEVPMGLGKRNTTSPLRNAGRDAQPLDRRLPDAQYLARNHLGVVVEHRPDPRCPRRLDGAGVLRRRLDLFFQQVEVALADVRVGRRLGE